VSQGFVSVTLHAFTNPNEESVMPETQELNPITYPSYAAAEESILRHWKFKRQMDIVQPWHVVTVLVVTIIIEHLVSKPMTLPTFAALAFACWLVIRGLWPLRILVSGVVEIWKRARQLSKQSSTS
jgi:hypothetical protein